MNDTDTTENDDSVLREYWLEEALSYADSVSPERDSEPAASFLRVLAEEIRRLRTPIRVIDDLPLSELNETERMETTMLQAFHSSCTVMDIWNTGKALDPEDE